MLNQEPPTPEENSLFEDILVPIVQGKFTSALIIFRQTEDSPVQVKCMTDVEEGLDLAVYAQIVLTESRRRVQYPEEYTQSDPGDETE